MKDLTNTINFLNKKRHIAIFLSTLVWIFVGICFCMFFVFIMLGLVVFSDLMPLFMVLGFISIIFCGFLSMGFVLVLKKYKQIFETTLFNVFTLDCYKDFSFSFKGTIDKNQLADNEIFNRYNNDGQSLYKGYINDIYFESCFFEYIGLEKGIKTKKGRVVIFKLNKELPHKYLIEYKKTKILKKKTKFNTVTKTESSVFNENYNIYVDDVFDSAKILSPSFISHLTDFINMYKCSVNILAKGLRIYVAVNNYNYFNFALMHKVDSLYVEQFRLELLMAYYLAKVFKYDFND